MWIILGVGLMAVGLVTIVFREGCRRLVAPDPHGDDDDPGYGDDLDPIGPIDDVLDLDDGRPRRTWPGFLPLPLWDVDDVIPQAISQSWPATAELLELFGLYVADDEVEAWSLEELDAAWDWIRDAWQAEGHGGTRPPRPECLKDRRLDELLLGTGFKLTADAAARMPASERRAVAIWAIAERRRREAQQAARLDGVVQLDRWGGR